MELVATEPSNSSGNAYYQNYQVDGTAKVFALKTANEQHRGRPHRPVAEGRPLSIQRDCPGNDCAGDRHRLRRARSCPGRRPGDSCSVFSSGTWTAVGSPVNTGADGKVAIQFSLDGVPQWTTRAYRLVVERRGSNQIQFMPGPTKLGKNVLRVDVDKGIYPVDKGPEYAGKATLSVDGESRRSTTWRSGGVRRARQHHRQVHEEAVQAEVPGQARQRQGLRHAEGQELDAAGELPGPASSGTRSGSSSAGKHGNNLDWTPDSRFVEMFVNDQYRGAYMMTESVKIDKTGSTSSETPA